MNEIEELQSKYRQFIRERNWERFNTPKNLAAALSIEASELLEVFLWLSDNQPLTPARLQNAQDEMADVFLYLLRLADTLNIDLLSAARSKFAKVIEKYPIEKSLELARKINESPSP